MKNSPQLQPPGAGLPPLELFIGKVGFVWYRSMVSWSTATAHLEAENQRIIAYATSVSEEVGKRKVLINRVTGIEDSSRGWSVFMVLEHLIIVTEVTIQVIESLSQEQEFPYKLKIAAIKPHEEVGSEIVPQFQQSVSDYRLRLKAVPKIRSNKRHAHPWFGLLDAHDWHCFSVLHYRVHRRQLQKIIECE